MCALDRVQGLLLMAHKDFDAMRGMIGNPLFADEIFGFHTQQAIEKLLKAWLALRSIDFPLTHDLSRLLGLLEEVGADIGVFWPFVQYTVFAVQARYESGLMESEAPLDRVAVVAEVEQLMITVSALAV